MKWREKSKRSEATLTVRMKHEGDSGMNGDSNLSHSVRASKKEDSQGTMTLTDNKRETTKTKDPQCIMTHALASTTLTDSLSVSGHYTRSWGYRSALRVTYSIVVAVPLFAISDLYANSW